VNRKKVVVGLSGGIDSSVAALLLVEQGYEVIGATLRIWGEEDYLDGEWHDRSCCKTGLARYAAEQLKIPYYIWDAHKEFKECVVDDFCNEYTKGRTPNPCTKCNEKIKFSLLREKALGIGADYIATGHYARISFDHDRNKYLLKKGLDPHKDQSYFLHRLTQDQLSGIKFPVGDYTKAEVTKIAESLDLPVSEMRESQEVCFVTHEGYREFIRERVPDAINTGRFVSTTGAVLGEHDGIPFYTIGQRRGLKVSAGERLYVLNIDAKKNEVVLGSEQELFANGLIATDIHVISGETLNEGELYFAKIRYRSEGVKAMVVPIGEGRIKVLFEEPQRAVTPGQSVVFYDNDVVVGGGIIEKSV